MLIVRAMSITAVLGLSACDSEASSAGVKSAVDVSNQAKETAKQVARDTARRQLCTYVETAASNRKLSGDEITGIRTSASVAEAAQVDQSLVDAAREIAKTPKDSAPPLSAIDSFTNACEQSQSQDVNGV